MIFTRRTYTILLFVGDIAILTASLWLTLVIRNLEFVSSAHFIKHLEPFAILFVVWVVVYFVAGLYEKHTVLFQKELPSLLLRAQSVNVTMAVLFFYFIPYFGITPKTNLFIYLAISFGGILLWRLYGFGFLGSSRKQNAVIIGGKKEARELCDEINKNPRANVSFVFSIDLEKIDGINIQQDLIERIYSEGIQFVAVDLRHPNVETLLPHLYNLIFSGVRFYDIHRFYEDVFDRISLSLVRYNWFLENISASRRSLYDGIKRLVDIVVAGSAGIIAVFVLYPFVAIAIKLDDGGPVFIQQTRIGKDNALIQTTKFRTMTIDDGGDETKKHANTFTRIGPFLRKTRIDEIPQLWDVVRGDVSLIGPRPELPALVKEYQSCIPYYDIRHLIKPGLSGWAQLYHKDPPKRNIDTERTKMKLSYDLYYIVNRSFFLDGIIILKTIKTLISRSGT